jgi:hypothetical protein
VRGRRREYHGGSSNTPDKVATAGAHPSGGSMVRCDGDDLMAMSKTVEALRGSLVVVRRTCSTGEPQGRKGMGPIGMSELRGVAHRGGRMGRSWLLILVPPVELWWCSSNGRG